MIQIIPAAQPKQSFASKLSEGMGRALNTAQQLKDEYTQKDLLAKQQQALSQLTGMDLSNISDPNILKSIAQEFVKGQAQEKKEKRRMDNVREFLKLDKKPPASFGDQIRAPGILSPEYMQQQQAQQAGQMGQMGQMQPGQDQGYLAEKQSNADILGLGILDPQLANLSQKMQDTAIRQRQEAEKFQYQKEQDIKKEKKEAKESKRKTYESDRDFSSKITTPIIQKAMDESVNLLRSEAALNNMDDAIRRQDVGFFTPDFFAEALNWPFLKTASGAQLSNAAKTFLMNDLSQLGRPNQWIEQRILSMTPGIGATQETNEAFSEGIRLNTDIKKAYNDEILRLSNQDFKEKGYSPLDLTQRALANIQPYVEERQKIAKYRMQDIYEREKNINSVKDLKKVEPGTPITARVAKILVDKYGANAPEAAKQLGYEDLGKEIYEKAIKR